MKRAGSHAKIIMLTTYELDTHVAAAIEDRAHGYALSIMPLRDDSSCQPSPLLITWLVRPLRQHAAA